jgi:hypothetical protein
MDLIVACFSIDNNNIPIMSKKTFFISIVSMLTMVIFFYVFVFNYVVPNAAKISIPYTWRNLPLMQDTSVVNIYLGTPFKEIKNNVLEESWFKGINNQQYQLSIQFSTTSNLAVSYKIKYHFEKWHLQKDYILEEKEINK